MAQPARSAKIPTGSGLTASPCATVCMACADTGHSGMEAACALLDTLEPTVTKNCTCARPCTAPRTPNVLQRPPPAAACLATPSRAANAKHLTPASHHPAPHWPSA